MHRTTIILAYLSFCVPSFAQFAESPEQYPFVHYTPKDGLVNSRVKKAYQDSKGRMYFLTYGGLSVFDGARFKNYTTQNGLATDLVNDILEVGNDSFLVATNFHSINALVKGKIVTLKTEGASCPLVNKFYRSDNNSVYLSSDDGLFVLEKNKIRALDISVLTKESPLLPYIGEICGYGNYLVISTNELKGRKGLYLYDIKNNRICDAMPDAKAYLLGNDKANNIWVSMSDKLFTLGNQAFSKGKLSLIPPVQGYQQTKNYSTINVAFDQHRIWLVFRNEDYRNKEIRSIEETGALLQIPLPEQATSSDIQNIFLDKEKTIWICNDGEGIFKIVHSPLRIFQNPFGQSAQSQVENVYYFNNITWYSTNNYKLFRRSGKGLEQFSCNIKNVPAIFQESENMLFASDGKIIYKGRFNNKRSIAFERIISLPENDFWGNLYFLDKKGTILTAQKSGIGIWLDQKRVFFIPNNNNDVIEGMHMNRDNLLWVPKRYSGIDVYSIHTENMLKYLDPVYHFTDKQIKGTIRSFIIDKNGFIWIGTRDNGLLGYRHDGNNLHQLYHFNVQNGLTDNFVTDLTIDSSNNLIVGTQTGLDRIINYQNNYQIENLSKSNNFFAYIKQIWVDQRNEVYALTSAGTFLQVSPVSSKTETKYTPSLLLEDVKVNAQSVPANKKDFLYKENNISFLMAAPSFIDEKRVTYSYFLEGSGNNKWSDTTSANSVINLTNLSAGSYVLKVKSYFPTASYAASEISFPFVVDPPWWQTWWFRSAAVSLIIVLLIKALRFYYRRKLERQMAILEKQQAIEKERTRIATDMHDDLGAGLSRIKFLSENIKANKGNDESLANDAEKISEYSDEMAAKMGEIVWALNEKNDTVADLVAFTRSYVQSYLSDRNLHCEIDTPLELPSTFITGEMRQNIFLSVKECLHNIIKHAEASQVYFSIKLDGAIEIMIHDNGKGINWKEIRPFSNGIQNIQKRMKEIHGKVNFLNDEGTKVILKIPCEL